MGLQEGERQRKKNTDTKHIKTKNATKPAVQVGLIAQIKLSGSKIIPSTSYPSTPLSTPPTVVSNEERKQDSIFSFLL